MVRKETKLNRSINLRTCVAILNNTLDKNFIGFKFTNGNELLFLDIDLNEKSKRDIGYIIFDEDDLDKYIKDNVSEKRQTLDITNLCKEIENEYRSRIYFNKERHKFSIAK